MKANVTHENEFRCDNASESNIQENNISNEIQDIGFKTNKTTDMKELTEHQILKNNDQIDSPFKLRANMMDHFNSLKNNNLKKLEPPLRKSTNISPFKDINGQLTRNEMISGSKENFLIEEIRQLHIINKLLSPNRVFRKQSIDLKRNTKKESNTQLNSINCIKSRKSDSNINTNLYVKNNINVFI